MSSFAPASSSSDDGPSCGSFDAADATFFAGIDKIPFRPGGGANDTMAFRHYDPKQVVMGRTMEEWLRFSVCFWHTFRGTGADPFGFPTLIRPWDDGSNTMANAKRRLRAAFEFFVKLGVKYWTFHDRDIAPEGATLAETNRNLDEITDLALELQKKTGVKCLWATSNLFASPKYMNGAASNPDSHVVALAAAQVKKCMEIAVKLGAENFVFWGGREGYHTILNTNVLTELTNMANFFKMAAAYKKKLGFTGNLLIEPKPKEPAKHQYDYDAMTVIGFLKHFGLDKEYKLNIEPNHTTLAGHGYEHDIVMASAFGMLGSVDSNTGSPDLGWDTDQFPMDVKNATLVLKDLAFTWTNIFTAGVVDETGDAYSSGTPCHVLLYYFKDIRAILEQGGLQPGGLNFDCKVRRESTDLRDMFISHIGAMDTFARGLKSAAAILEDGVIPGQVKERYSSFQTGIGEKINKGQTSFEELEEYVTKNGIPSTPSGRQEHYESMMNHYV